jgi:hypothetical protein
MKRPTTVEPNSFGGSITLSRRTYAACEYSPVSFSRDAGYS